MHSVPCIPQIHVHRLYMQYYLYSVLGITYVWRLILSWLQNDGRSEFSVNQLKGTNFSQHFDVSTRCSSCLQSWPWRQLEHLKVTGEIPVPPPPCTTCSSFTGNAEIYINFVYFLLIFLYIKVCTNNYYFSLYVYDITLPLSLPFPGKCMWWKTTPSTPHYW